MSSAYYYSLRAAYFRLEAEALRIRIACARIDPQATPEQRAISVATFEEDLARTEAQARECAGKAAGREAA